MSPNMRNWIVSLAILTGFLGGCAQMQPLGGRPAPKLYTNMASLSPNTTEVLDKGRPGDVKARTKYCNNPEARNPIIIGDVKPYYEKIAQVKPDFIILDPTLYSESDIAKLKQVAPNATIFEFEVYTVDQFIEKCYELGKLVGGESYLSEYVDKVYAERSRAMSQATQPNPKVAVVMTGGNGDYMAAGIGSFLADVVRASGGQPVGPDNKKFVPVSVEALVALNPDVMITDGDAKKILLDPRLQTVGAIKNRRVAKIKGDVLLRAGSRVNILIQTLGAFIANREQK